MANLKDLIVNGSARILGSLYANLSGNADTATKLETARTIRVNLGSSSAVGFDGTANITPGMYGTLPVANGGTGQTSIANIQAGKDADGNVISTTYVKKTGDETIAGVKTFSSAIQRTATLSTGGNSLTKLTDTNNKGTVYNEAFYANTSIINRLVSTNTTANKHFYFDVNVTDGGNGWVSIGGNASNLNTSQAESGTSSSVLATKGWVNNPAASTNVVHRSDNETISGVKTFGNSTNSYTLTINGKSNDETSFAALMLHVPNKRYSLLKVKGDTQGVQVRKGDDSDYDSIYCKTESTSDNSNKAATTSYVKSNLQNYLQTSDQGDLLPNFDVMPVLQTIEFDTSDSNWHTILTRTNTETNAKDLNDILYFRVTVTGTSINHKIDYLVNFRGQLNYPIIISNNFPGTGDANYCGPRYIRAIYPKALNNGYNWSIEFLQNRNNNARHYKIEVFKTTSKVTWTQGTSSIYNGTYHNSAQWGVENTAGYWINWFNGSFNQSSWANNLNGQLSKFFNTNLPAGEALLVNQFIYMNNNKHYPATNKTLAIEPGYGIQFTVTAYKANADVGWDRVRQKQRMTSLTNIPHATLAKGNPCYFRCTMDANGNILSDNYVDTSMGNGYTWYYVGVAESATVINIDTTQSFFLTLDSNGKLTHINGKQVGGSADTSDCVKLTGNQTITGIKWFAGSNTVFSPNPNTSTPSVQITGGNGTILLTSAVGNVRLKAANGHLNVSNGDNNIYYQVLDTSDTEVVHTVIETYSNGTNWYRVYDDGWVEQGGMVSVPKTGTSVELLREMTDTNYSILLGGSGTSAGQDGNNVFWYAKTITSISLSNKQYGTDNQTRNCYWYVCGYGAEVFYL